MEISATAEPILKSDYEPVLISTMAEPFFLPQETLDHTISCRKYEMKPVTEPTMAMPLLAMTEPVKR